MNSNCCETLVPLPGAAGASACTNTTADFTIPTSGPGYTVTVNVVNTQNIIPASTVVTPGPAHFEVISVTNATQVVLQFTPQAGDVASGTVVASRSLLCPTGEAGAAGTNGFNGYGTLTSLLTVPSPNQNITVAVDNTGCFEVGEYVITTCTSPVIGPANFKVISVNSATSLTIQFLNNTGDVVTGSTAPIDNTIAAAGSAGQNAFNYLTGSGIPVIPPVGATVNATVVSTQWMAEGQNVFISSNLGYPPVQGATFNVYSINSPTSVTLTYLGYVNDLAPGNSLPNNSIVTPTGTQPITLSTVTQGNTNSYTVTTTPTNLGINLVIPAAGTYRITGRLNFNYSAGYNGYNSSLNPTSCKIVRTNNTPSDLAASTWFPSAITITYKQSGFLMIFEVAIYLTTNINDNIDINVGNAFDPTAGTITIDEMSLIAEPIG